MQTIINKYKELAPDIFFLFISAFIFDVIFYDIILSLPELKPDWDYKIVASKLLTSIVFSLINYMRKKREKTMEIK